MKTVEEIDAEIQKTQNQINELFALQQRLLGYKQALIDKKEDDGTGESISSN